MYEKKNVYKNEMYKHNNMYDIFESKLFKAWVRSYWASLWLRDWLSCV